VPFAAPFAEQEETLVFVMTYEGLSALANDLAVIGFLDDHLAAGFRVLMPLGAQILHVREGERRRLPRLPGLRRWSGRRAYTLERRRRLLALLNRSRQFLRLLLG
jgi:hypothetical protein